MTVGYSLSADTISSPTRFAFGVILWLYLDKSRVKALVNPCVDSLAATPSNLSTAMGRSVTNVSSSDTRILTRCDSVTSSWCTGFRHWVASTSVLMITCSEGKYKSLSSCVLSEQLPELSNRSHEHLITLELLTTWRVVSVLCLSCLMTRVWLLSKHSMQAS